MVIVHATNIWNIIVVVASMRIYDLLLEPASSRFGFAVRETVAQSVSSTHIFTNGNVWTMLPHVFKVTARMPRIMCCWTLLRNHRDITIARICSASAEVQPIIGASSLLYVLVEMPLTTVLIDF
jgi:hypothetical protein